MLLGKFGVLVKVGKGTSSYQILGANWGRDWERSLNGAEFVWFGTIFETADLRNLQTIVACKDKKFLKSELRLAWKKMVISFAPRYTNFL